MDDLINTIPRNGHILMRHFFNLHYGNEEEVTLLKFYEGYYKEFFKEHLEKQQKINEGNKDEELKKYNFSNPFGLEVINKIYDAQRNLINLIVQKWIDKPDADDINISKREMAEALFNVPDIAKSSTSYSIFAQVIMSKINDNNRIIIPFGRYLLGL
ncbi:MAG: hypothetical protein ACYCVH_09500 [Ignavibacteriaceae bacterium]